MLEFLSLLSIPRENETSLRKFAHDRRRRCNQPGMPLHIAVHVAHQHDQLALASAGKKLAPVACRPTEPLQVHPIVDDLNFLGCKPIFGNQPGADGIRIGQHHVGKILNASQPHSPPGLIPVEVRDITAAGDDHRHARHPRRWHSHQIRPKVVGMNDVKVAATQKSC